ncbi:MAG TPA: site-specific DNA-methyltransferase [Acidimicrobiia bacterium]|nr:site-specific DNA-methyltransferase [Acidimicrobiia bacterium]
MTTERRGTSTSRFGVSRRENHDSSLFYERFELPLTTDDSDIDPRRDIDDIFLRDARSMPELNDNSVALVVTSPPYFAGKEYEAEVGSGHVPASYADYLKMLEEVFAECVDKLEPGGRIAVNVANLGRRPYRALSADVIQIFERLRLLLRGEIIWVKARGASGSTAWGTFQRPANPVLRDLTERVIVASKGRFDRALSARERAKKGHPHEASIWREEFMDATTDVWEIPPESANRVGHPAPFPVALPKRLIELYTYRSDLVLDPFIGSGTAAIAALQTGRHFAGYEIESEYRDRALARIAEERKRLKRRENDVLSQVSIPGFPQPADESENFQSRAVREGRAAKDIAEAVLLDAGFGQFEENVAVGAGVKVNLAAWDQSGTQWYFDISGGFTSSRPGLARTDTLWKALGKAAAMQQAGSSVPLVLLTTNSPEPRSAGAQALRAMRGADKAVYDVIELLNREDLLRLKEYAIGGPPSSRS